METRIIKVDDMQHVERADAVRQHTSALLAWIGDWAPSLDAYLEIDVDEEFYVLDDVLYVLAMNATYDTDVWMWDGAAWHEAGTGVDVDATDEDAPDDIDDFSYIRMPVNSG